MKQYPSTPRVADAPSALFESGHLWLQEKVDGATLRFQLRDNGLIRFGDRNRVYDRDEIPTPYGHAVRHVRENLDRDALRAAVDDVSEITFFGEATHRHAIDYDWERMPSFLGFDVWSASKGRFLPPDAVERIYRRLGLDPIETFRKEVRATDFSPDRYEIPDSNWYDGPAQGVVVRNKVELRAKLLHPRFREVDDAKPVDGSAEALARRYATDRRFEKLVRTLDAGADAVTLETLFERAFEDIVREEHGRLFHADTALDRRAFRSAVAARTRQFLADGGRSS